MYSPERLRQVLREQGRSGNWLADVTEYDPSTVSRFLNGSQPISEKFASRAARFLGIPVEWLLAEDRVAA
jgi:transcriptional regulator with XRE-family HTH domain